MIPESLLQPGFVCLWAQLSVSCWGVGVSGGRTPVQGEAHSQRLDQRGTHRDFPGIAITDSQGWMAAQNPSLLSLAFKWRHSFLSLLPLFFESSKRDPQNLPCEKQPQVREASASNDGTLKTVQFCEACARALTVLPGHH